MPRRRWCCCMRASAASACGPIFPTSFQPRPAPACWSIRAPVTANRARSPCRADVDNAFKGWNGAWLDPGFRNWDITEYLAYIRVPILIVQGKDDQYGTVKQIEVANQECYCPVEVALLPGARHSPQRDAPATTLAAIAKFVARVLASETSAGDELSLIHI